MFGWPLSKADKQVEYVPDCARRHFVHSQNEHGDFESVCPDCLECVAIEAVEADLQVVEGNHVCDLATISRLWKTKRCFQGAKDGSSDGA